MTGVETKKIRCRKNRKMCEFKIEDLVVGPNHPPLVIAEVGINHEGELDKALKCVDAAVNAGAKVVKFQCHGLGT